MQTTRKPPIQRDWVAKTLAGTLLGFVLAIEASALYVRFGPQIPLGTNGQLGMWLVPPVWMAVLSLCFLFQTGLRAWAWLGGAALVVLAVLTAAGARG